MSAPIEQTHFINGPAGTLELRLLPAMGTPRGLAVICHPHPQHGGSMDNKVVYTVQRALSGLGFISARFNFRGVGKSAGEFDHGRGESDDARALVAWLKAQYPALPTLWLAGFSFGSFVAALVANELGAAQLISIAPPVQRFDFVAMPMPSCPWLVVMGDADEVVDPQAVFDWLDSLAMPPKLVRMAGAGHFFHGRLTELKEHLERELPAL